jgi:isopenicillin N synthase-like dioxygenase
MPAVLPCMQVFTNDAFYASNHRVLKSVGRERYSRAFFFNPSFKADIAPSPELTIAGGWQVV